MSERPILFISHSSKDGHIANVLKEQIEALLNIEVFETSHFSAIEGGKEWFEVITEKLDKAKALLVLASYNSRFSQWVHWEIGYFYKKSKYEDKTQSIYVATIGGEQSFNTLQVTQMKSLNDRNEASFLLQTIGNYFGFPFAVNSYEKIIEEILQVVPIYFSDDSAKEKLRDYLEKDYISERWIDYLELDKEMKFSTGTSVNLISELVNEYQHDVNDSLHYIFIVMKENENGIRLARNGKLREINIQLPNDY